MGTCPLNSPIMRTYAQSNCSGQSVDKPFYTALQFGKCYHYHTSSWTPGYNMDAMCRGDGYLYIYSYNSGCHAGADAMEARIYRAGICINSPTGTSHQVVGCP